MKTLIHPEDINEFWTGFWKPWDGKRVDEPEEERNDGELISILDETNDDNNVVEEETQMRTVCNQTLRLSEEFVPKWAAWPQASAAKWPLCLFELIKCGWSSTDRFIYCLIIYTDGRYDANDAFPPTLVIYRRILVWFWMRSIVCVW
jgi:hypothetical protein